MLLQTLVIVNPKSRGGRRAGRWPAVEEALRSRLKRLEVEFTRGPRDAERLAREGVRAGARRIVVAGGDGTANEVASGLLSAAIGHSAEIGLLPFGTGRDLARGLGITGGIRGAIDAIVTGRTRSVDAGRVTYREPDRDRGGSPQVSHFLNVGSVGLAAAVVNNVTNWSKSMGGQLAFATGFARSLRGWRASPLSISVDGKAVIQGSLDLAAVANGRFFGGGMKLAPSAELDDGLLDLIVVRSMSAGKWLRRIPLVYSGRHLKLDEVSHFRGRRIEVEWNGAAAEAPGVELDGEAGGRAPVSFEVLPGALRVLVPSL